MINRFAGTAALLALFLAVTACSGSGDGPGTAAGSGQSAEPEQDGTGTAEQEPDDPEEDGDGDANRESADVLREITALDGTWLTDARFGTHEDKIRLVVDIVGEMPEYKAEDVDEITTHGDFPPDVPGEAFVQLWVWPAAAYHWDEEHRRTTVYQGPGPGVETEGLPEGVTGFVFQEFEGSSTLGVALDRAVDWELSELSGPNRIVLDLHR
ncbi:hypothetical protein PJ985_18250 [Streptomyces sp. ACA25]|uniref:AMIN-like domain-containing (lipo)protein n=1 Tax=Streptomyces sp. ACA25 TaxID=3022596 RepID=UPI002307331B|nr:hypothetical protein [Streptomyces sp. ACA25]MDB1089505.1 hypothetical protein [Streptomyces sp. ACA25]